MWMSGSNVCKDVSSSHRYSGGSFVSRCTCRCVDVLVSKLNFPCELIAVREHNYKQNIKKYQACGYICAVRERLPGCLPKKILRKEQA